MKDAELTNMQKLMGSGALCVSPDQARRINEHVGFDYLPSVVGERRLVPTQIGLVKVTCLTHEEAAAMHADMFVICREVIGDGSTDGPMPGAVQVPCSGAGCTKTLWFSPEDAPPGAVPECTSCACRHGREETDDAH
jgi:hypothetical protein